MSIEKFRQQRVLLDRGLNLASELVVHHAIREQDPALWTKSLEPTVDFLLEAPLPIGFVVLHLMARHGEVPCVHILDKVPEGKAKKLSEKYRALAMKVASANMFSYREGK